MKFEKYANVRGYLMYIVGVLIDSKRDKEAENLLDAIYWLDNYLENKQ